MLLWMPLALAVEPPSFDVERGLQTAPFVLNLAPDAPADRLFYTLGSGSPDQPYTQPLLVQTTTIVRAWAVDSDGAVSALETHSYLFVDDVLASSVMSAAIVDDPVYGPAAARSLSELPSLSIVTEHGIGLDEAPISFEWIDPDGDDLGINAGAKKVGNASVNYAKYNIRLYFRAAYGPTRMTLDLYPEHATGVPPVDTHDALNLRSGSHDSVFYLGAQAQYLRNRWMDETQLEMGHIAPHGRYGHLYLNGQYHGVFHVRERFNAAFLAEYLGGEDDDYEAVNGGSVIDGSGAAWAQVRALAGDYQAVRSWLNVENLLDYMILNFYAANAWDWLYYHNWMGAGPSAPDQGGYVFHSSDSDICLVYDHTTDILHLGGPDNLFTALLTEADRDFLVLLADRLYAHLGPDGLLSPDAAADRYERLAVAVEDAMAAETARWGAGWWERDDEWTTERIRLRDDFFPYRTDSLLAQVRARGWLTVPAPVLDVPQGLTPPGSTGTAQVPAALQAELWVRLDGGDPRLPGGAVADQALGPDPSQTLTFPHSAQVGARLRQAGAWGPLVQAWVEVDEAPPLVLNEWNAVGPDKLLAEGDDALGVVAGNGGDWLELVVVQDGLDLRGWQLTLSHRNGDAGTLVFQDHPLLADLPAGTLFTIAEDLPEDLRFDPDGGDWRFHLRAGAEGSGEVVSATPFDVSHREWQAVLRDAEGWVRFGPVGEGLAPADGISGTEVGVLGVSPGPGVRRDDRDYRDADRSSFGAANVWSGGQQDLGLLRDRGDFGVRLDSGDTGDSAVPVGDTGVVTPDGCGCATAPGPGAAVGGWALLALWWRRRTPVLLVAAVGCADGGTATPGDSDPDTAPAVDCYADLDGDGFGAADTVPVPCGDHAVPDDRDCDDGDPWTSPLGTEVCGGGDEDCDGLVDGDDPDVADPLPFFVDGDGDGHGGVPAAACALGPGLAASGGDCDDDDPAIHPDAAELCDDVDQNCDGTSDDALGASAECALESCLAALDVAGVGADGAYWLRTSSGAAAQVWCDLTTDGGGWTLGFLRSSVGSGDQPDFGAGEVGLEALGVSVAMASADGTARMGWLDLNETAWSELQVSAGASGSPSWRSEAIPRAHLRLAFGEPGYLLYGGESPYYWCGGPASYTDSGVGQVDPPAGAYADCKGHGSLGSGWDFSQSPSANQGLSLCGSDGSAVMHSTWAGAWTYFGNVGAAQGIWVR